MTHLYKKLFNLKLAAKQITKNANKLKKDESKEMHKCLKCVMRGELDIGRVHAENAVRNHNQSLDLLKLESRLQGSINVLQAAIGQNQVQITFIKETLPLIHLRVFKKKPVVLEKLKILLK